jgi:protein-S-isoprenylcysteine O-methyltransferase Ste14
MWMGMQPDFLFAVIWIAWLVSWIAAAFWTGRTERRAPLRQALAQRAALILGALLLFYSARQLHMGVRTRLWNAGPAGGYVLAGVTLLGILFAWWARLHLGRLWSSAITRKEHHRVVDSGPYALVRHPIYTGLIVALVATAAEQATLLAFIAVATIVVGFWLKARAEERFLMQELGADAYGAYRRRVPMLFPFKGRGR